MSRTRRPFRSSIELVFLSASVRRTPPFRIVPAYTDTTPSASHLTSHFRPREIEANSFLLLGDGIRFTPTQFGVLSDALFIGVYLDDDFRLRNGSGKARLSFENNIGDFNTAAPDQAALNIITNPSSGNSFAASRPPKGDTNMGWRRCGACPDPPTARLMTAFYAYHRYRYSPDATTAEALLQAQRSLLELTPPPSCHSP